LTLDEHLLVGHPVLLGLFLTLLPLLRVSHVEGDGVLEGFPEHIATLLHPPNLISNAVNCIKHVPYVLCFVAFVHFYHLAEIYIQHLYHNVVLVGAYLKTLFPRGRFFSQSSS
jgi:hypothetical protein